MRTLIAAAVFLSGLPVAHAVAQGGTPGPLVEPEPVIIDPHVYEPSFLGTVVESVGHYTVYFWETITGSIAPPTPASFASDFGDKDPYSFWTLLSDAGYKLKEIESDVGLIPDVSFTFKNVRELSEADIEWLERKLEKHADVRPGWISAIQRSILYTLLQINDSNEYFVETLTVTMLPLPKAKFSLEPWDGGLPEEFDILLRAIQGRDITPRRGPRGGT